MKNNYKAAQYLITAFHLQFSVRMEEQERFDKMNWNGSLHAYENNKDDVRCLDCE